MTTIVRRAIFRPQVVLLAAIAAQAIFCELFALSWIAAFIKVGPQHIYPLLYFAILFSSLVVVLPREQKSSVVAATLIGAVLGQLIAMISIVLYGLLLPDGFERLANSLQLGIMGILLAVAWGAVALGGWLFGAVSAAVIQLAYERQLWLKSP